MIQHPRQPGHVLWEVADEDRTPAEVRAIFDWTRRYLSKPHADLGRAGPVCPYVPLALRSASIYVSVQPGVPTDGDAVADTILGYRDWFAELEPRTGPPSEAKTILILFPDLPAPAMPELIDRTQAALKPSFVENGLMIGEFHPSPPDQPGLWNPDFRPLRSPVPLLAIRHMVPSDLPFLVHDRGFLTSYLARFDAQVPARCQTQLDEAMARHGLGSHRPARTGHALPADISAAVAGIPHTVHCHAALPGPVRSPGDLAAALRLPVHRITKTLLVRGDRGVLLRLLTPVGPRLDLDEIAAALGHRRLRLAPLTTLDEVLGQPAGAVSPLGAPGVPVVLDSALLVHPTVLVGAGVARVEIELAPADLVTLASARVMPFAGTAPQTAVA